MVVRTKQTTLEGSREEACLDMDCGLSRDNVERAARLIAEGGAVLKIHVYPWGAEFDVVEKGSDWVKEDDANGL